jgi:hypothetical protein
VDDVSWELALSERIRDLYRDTGPHYQAEKSCESRALHTLVTLSIELARKVERLEREIDLIRTSVTADRDRNRPVRERHPRIKGKTDADA